MKVLKQYRSSKPLFAFRLLRVFSVDRGQKFRLTHTKRLTIALRQGGTDRSVHFSQLQRLPSMSMHISTGLHELNS